MKDLYGREITYLRLSVTELCNLRCAYCMPAGGVCKRAHEEMLTEDEMIAAVECAAGIGVRKVRITGGEPLVKKNILSICERAAKVSGIGEVCLTTNGTLLAPLAAPLRAAGVRRINISMDTLDAEKYARITRGGRLDDALAGLEAALSAGFDRVKVNAVLLGGVNDDEIASLAALTQKHPVDVRFIELMLMSGTAREAGTYVPCDAVLEKLPDAVEQEADGGVARLYRLPDAQGCVGLISPRSAHFCAWCNRLRVTADGHLKPCLHAPDLLCIKGCTKGEMRERFERAVFAKPRCHGELTEEAPSEAGRSMNRIGG